MYAAMLALTVGAIEVLSYAAARYVRNLGLIYDPARVTQTYADYLALRDPELGWGPRQRVAANHVAGDGTRRDPVFPVAAKPCLSLFGDSYTWAAEVSDREAWGSLLAARLDCRVANYGVAGYGSDQAYLRFRSLAPQGDVVLLNHLSENVLRNVNQFRNLLYTGGAFGLKPRFIADNGAARLIPLPEIAAADIAAFLAEPARNLQHEYFLPGGPAGVQKMAFPYSVTVAKTALWGYHVHAKLAGVPRHTDFYRPDHASHALAVTHAIVRAFAREATARGQIPVATLLPLCVDLHYFKAKGVFPYEPLKTLIAADRIRVIDFGREIAARLGAAPPDSLYSDSGCSGHFSAAGNRMVADIAFDYLQGDPEIRPRLAARR